MTPEEIRAARERLGMSQGRIAQRLGVDRGTWHRWERGRQAIRYPRILGLALRALAREVAAERGEPAR